MHDLARRVEHGGVFSCPEVSTSAQPFLAALFRRLLPARPLVVVTEGLRTQESFHQDIGTWLKRGTASEPKNEDEKRASPAGGSVDRNSEAHFYPAWEILPHEDRLPHVDVISDRLETLLAAAEPNASPLIVTSVTALLQRTFPPQILEQQTR